MKTRVYQDVVVYGEVRANSVVVGGTLNALTLGSNTIAAIKEIIYPVGTVYISTDSVSPAKIVGGTWKQIRDRFLFAASSLHPAGAYGGSETHQHDSGTISALLSADTSSIMHGKWGDAGADWTATQKFNMSSYGALSPTKAHCDAVQTNGETATASSMPPYFCVYMWERIS